MFSSNTSQVSNDAVFVEDVFSTWLYTGTGSNLTITNGIDLSGNGGLVWIKRRSTAEHHHLSNTVSGPLKFLCSNKTDPEFTDSNGVQSFDSTGFVLGNRGDINYLNETYTSWTFRKQPKFFDVQTATTNGSSSYGSTVPSMTITHSLGSVPGCVIVKRTDGTGDWYVWHRSLPALSGLAQTATYARLNTTGAAAIFGGNVNGTGGWIQATSTTIYLDAWFNTYEPGTFVVYIYAHNAGGFGTSNADNVISCGSYTGNGAEFGSLVNLGYEPQWLLVKNASSSSESWFIVDNMRGFSVESGTEDSGDAILFPNLSNAEINRGRVRPEATGFTPRNFWNVNGNTFIYIAIRRGPMKTPTSGTSVFAPLANTTTTQTTNFVTDSGIVRQRDGNNGWCWGNRLMAALYLESNSSSAEFSTPSNAFTWQSNTSYVQNLYGSNQNINYAFRRAPGFYDVVCYKGTAPTAQNVSHNLSVAPEMMIIKDRSLDEGWRVYHAALGKAAYLVLETTAASSTSTDIWNNTSPTATTFTVGNYGPVNGGTLATENFVAYLFASCPGVSKVGSYTGSGTTKQIDCGFTGGARFVLIKRTDSSGDWYVWDSARGIVAGNDPYLLLNSNAPEVTNTDYVDTYAAGFEISSTAPAAINANGGTFIFLAIA